jgi:hypothetical protein
MTRTIIMPDDDIRLPAGWREAPTKTYIAMEIHHALSTLQAPPALLAIVAKWMLSSGSDEDILHMLREFNALSSSNQRQARKKE